MKYFEVHVKLFKRSKFAQRFLLWNKKSDVGDLNRRLFKCVQRFSLVGTHA